MEDEKDGVVAESTEQQVETPPENKDGWIPKQRFDEAMGKLKDDLRTEREERIRLEERVKLGAEKKDTKEEVKYTAAQLQALVDEGKLTNAEMVSYMVSQAKVEAAEEAEKRITAKLSEGKRSETIETEMDRYKSLIPACLEEGTEDRRKLRDEYSYLIKIGLPPGVTTELAAARNAFGPIEKIEKRVKSVTREARETHEESGGDEEVTQPKALKGLDNRKKEYYRQMIDKGIYKDWDAVAKIINRK